jgi:hypothetical protein|tara:strand:+ start:48 stop:290 length:243 start_codon:yes stop_codon:yes gene_type:complete
MAIEVLKIVLLFCASGIIFASVIYLQHRRQIKKQFEELINYPTLLPDIVYPNEDMREDLSRNRLIYDRRLKKWIKLREID